MLRRECGLGRRFLVPARWWPCKAQSRGSRYEGRPATLLRQATADLFVSCLGRMIMATDMSVRRVDHSAIRVNQACIIVLLILAFVLNSPLLAAFVSLVMLVGAAFPGLALFQQIYRRLLEPAGLVKADVEVDNPEPHRFAQGF